MTDDPDTRSIAELARPPSAKEPPKGVLLTRRGGTLTPAQARQYARQECSLAPKAVIARRTRRDQALAAPTPGEERQS